MQTAEHSGLKVPLEGSTPLPEKEPRTELENKIASTQSEAKRPDKTLPVISAQELKPKGAIHEEITAGLHVGFYREQVVTLLSLSSSGWEKGQKSVHAFYGVASPFCLPVVGVSEEEKSRTLVMAELPKTRCPEWLSTTAADSWVLRCRLVRDVAVALYQCRAAGARYISWSLSRLFLDAQDRAQILPCLSETAMAEADDIIVLAQLLWCMASRRSTILVNGWEQGKGLPRACPPEVIVLIQACTNSIIKEVKVLAKGLDVLWQHAEQGFSDTLPALPQKIVPISIDQKYEDPLPMDPTATITQTQLNTAQSSGSLNLLLVNDETLSWLNPTTDLRYQVGIKICALRDSLAQLVKSKASLPKLQQKIQRTLIEGSKIEMLLWLGEEGEDPSHSLHETAWRLWQAPQWQTYRQGDPPPRAWLPLLINFDQPGVSSPLLTGAHQPPEGVIDFTESEWQLLRSQFAPFWLVQGIDKLNSPSNLYDSNTLHQLQGRTRLCVHSTRSVVFKLEESTYFIPHGREDQLLLARYARYSDDPHCDFWAWKGRYLGKIGPASETTLAPSSHRFNTVKDLALNRNKLTVDEKTLGKGAFGDVLQGTYDGQPVAVKRFREAKLSAKDQAQLKDEAAVMANLQSPFLIHLLGLSLESPPLLVMELAEGGSLYHRLKDENQALPWIWRLQVLRDIALGLSVLHDYGLLHRDLKSLNILLDINGRAKLCDFGLSILKSQAEDTSKVGSTLWNAPEVLQGKTATPASDIYSFAMICWEVVTRRLPYSDPKTGLLVGDRDWSEQVVAPLVIQGRREIIPDDCPSELAMVIQACWAQDPTQRPTASQVTQVLEGLWQEALTAKQSSPSVLMRQSGTPPHSSSPIQAESKRTEPLARKQIDEKSLSIHSGEVKTMSSGTTAPGDYTPSIYNDPDLLKQPEVLASLMLVTTRNVTSTDRKAEYPLKPAPKLGLSVDSKLTIDKFNKILLAKSQEQPSCWQDKLSPHYTLGVKLQVLRQKVLADPYITQELSCYIASNGQSQAGMAQSAEPLYPWVERELLQGTTHVLLLQGLAGAGKSTFNRYLLRTLWQDPAWQSYRPGDPAPRVPIPVFIPLQSAQVDPQNLWDYYHHLPEISFTSEEISLLQSDYHTLWIADGYDEMPGQAAPNLYDVHHLNHTSGRVKMVISCRSQRIQALVEADSFVPHVMGIPDWLCYRTRYVSPFTVQQTQDYIKKYVTQSHNDPERPVDWDAARYQAEFKMIPELQALIDTPFILWMTLSILPELAKEQLPIRVKTPAKTKDSTDEKTIRKTKETSELPEVKASLQTGKTPITRAALYDRFMDKWFTRQAKKAYQQRSYLTDTTAILGEARKQALKQEADQTGGDDVQVYWLKAAYRVFCLTFAEHLFQRRQVGLRYESISTPESKTTSKGETLSRLLGDTLPDSARLRQGSPLRESSDHTWSFMYASLFDYFITTSMMEQLLLTPESGSSLSEVNSLWVRNYSQAVTLLTQQRLTPDQVHFLVDRTRDNPTLQTVFFQLIELSKTDGTIAIAGGNAATVLNVSGIDLIGRDWQRVCIPGANLRYGILAHINLSGADLTGANLTRTWLYGANLEGARLEDVEWGEQPKLECRERILAMAYHPQYPWLAIAQSQTIEIRHRETGEIVGKPLIGHRERVNSVSFSPDGQMLASGSVDNTVRLWQVASQEPLGAPFTGHKNEVMSVSFSPDGQTLASGSKDETVRLWSVSSHKLLGVPLIGHQDSVRSVSFSPDGQTLASGSWDKTVRLWSVSSQRLLGAPLTGHTHWVNSVSFSPDGQTLASVSYDQTVRLWQVASREPLGTLLTGHERAVTSVSFSPDGQILASGSEDKTVRLWSVVSQEPLGAPLTGHQDYVTNVSFSPDGQMLASGSLDKTVRLWQVASREPQGAPFTGHKDEVMSVSFSPDGQTLASGSMDQTVRLWQVTGREPLGAPPLIGHHYRVLSVAFSPDSQTLVSGSDDHTARLYSVSSQKLLGAPVGHKGGVWSVTFSPNGELLASGSADKTVRLWSVASDEPQSVRLIGHEREVKSVAFSPDGQTLASGSVDKTVRLWSVRSREPQGAPLTGHQGSVWSVSFSPDGQILASGSIDKTVRLWSVRSREPQGAPLIGHQGPVWSVSFSPDGQTLASGSVDGTVRLWSVASHRCLTVFTWSAAIYSIAFQRSTIRPNQWGDDQLLATGDENGVIGFWLLSTGLCRNTEQTEIKTHFPDEKTQQPQPSEWRLLASSRYSGMQLWVHGVRLSGCRMSLLSKRLLEQYGADVSKVKLITAQPDEQSPHQEYKYETAPPETALPKLQTLVSIPTISTEAKERESKETPSRSIFSNLLTRRPHYSNPELLAQADQLIAGITQVGAKQHYLAKLAYYREHIHILNKKDRKSLKELLHTLRQIASQSTTTESHLTPEQKSKFSLGFLKGLKSQLKSLPVPITSTSSSCSSSSSSSTMSSTMSTSQSGRLFAPVPPCEQKLSVSAELSTLDTSMLATNNSSQIATSSIKNPYPSWPWSVRVFAFSPLPGKKLQSSARFATPAQQTPLEQAHALLNEVYLSQADRYRFLRRLTKYEKNLIDGALISADHKDMEDLLQTLRDLRISSQTHTSINVFVG